MADLWDRFLRTFWDHVEFYSRQLAAFALTNELAAHRRICRRWMVDLENQYRSKDPDNG